MKKQQDTSELALDAQSGAQEQNERGEVAVVVKDKASVPAAPRADTEVGAFANILASVAQRGNATPEEIVKWMDLHERAKASQARREFSEAMALFQQNMPTIVKCNSVADRSGKVMYRFANADDISRAIRPVEAECGFFHRFEFTPREGGGCVATCIVSHVGGHSERTTVTIPPTKGMNTNAAQDNGIEMQYGMRYALIGAYGITSANADTDGRVPGQNGAGGGSITLEQEAALKELLAATGRTEDLFCLANGIAKMSDLPAGAYEGNRRLLKTAADKKQRAG